ncbi:hypothetical protein CUMW_036070 [Citrus unshiu]|nr:hypothetical protein CUMW_036070 [Citrus unshiu]
MKEGSCCLVGWWQLSLCLLHSKSHRCMSRILDVIIAFLHVPLLMMCSVIEGTGSKHKINGELYNALLIREDEQKVIELCRKVPDHALYILTIHHDTVLHMATYSKKRNLVLKLLDELPNQYLDKMTRQNQAGNTILHETATSNLAIPVAEKLLKKEPGLLGMRNNNGETALLRAARYGKADIFNFLAGRVSGYDLGTKLPFLHRNDKTNVLHIAILSQHFAW